MKTTRQYGERIDLSLSLWVKLARAAGTMGRLAAKDIATYNLTQPQFAVLESLGHLGPMCFGALSRKMLVSGGNTTVVVDNLVREGLVERVPSSEDRRQVMVQLTPAGKKKFKDIFAKHARYIASLTDVLTKKEQEGLARLAKKLGTSLNTR